VQQAILEPNGSSGAARGLADGVADLPLGQGSLKATLFLSFIRQTGSIRREG
jgi:hypothetical protein